MNCPDSMRNFLSNFKTGDQYNLEEIGKFAPVSDLTRWINEPIDEILISSQYSSDILKQILEDRGL